MNYVLKLDNAYKRMKRGDIEKDVLKGANLEVEKGKITSIIGESGAGKSVLLKCAIGALRLDSGSIELHGEDITHYNDSQLISPRIKTSFVFQHGALYGSLTVRDNILLFLREHYEASFIDSLVNSKGSKKIAFGIMDREKYDRETYTRNKIRDLYDYCDNNNEWGRRLEQSDYNWKVARSIVNEMLEQRAREVVEKVGLVPYDADGEKDYSVLDKLPSDLSGGQQKRVALARGVAPKPDLFMYDEPVSGLDPKRTEIISELIKSFRIRGATSIVVSHSIPSTREISDSVALLYDGQIVFCGNWDKLKSTKDKHSTLGNQKFPDKDKPGEKITLRRIIDEFSGYERDYL